MNLSLRPVRFGILLSLISVFVGFALGGVFGAFEDNLKANLKGRAEPVKESIYGGDEAKMEKVVSKSFTYFVRAHLHAGALGTFGVVACILISLLSVPSPLVQSIHSFAFGLGAFGYSLFWLLAGMRAPALGGTGAAKESLQWLAIPSAGLLILGTATLIVVAGLELFRKRA